MINAGTHFGRYEIKSLLGAGGMGEVYRAFDARINREVAVKVLPASFSKDKDRLARFEQEAQAAGALNHPNILAIYDVDTHDGAPYVVSELLEGETLRAAMGGGALSVRRATDYALQIANGLAAAHEKGIVHRDLKPENLFITKDGRLKILDFGLAKLTQADGNQSQTEIPTRRVDTEPGMVLGTIGYMSPEQVRGRPVDNRSDIFSFGAILYEMLSGKRAFHGESAADTMSAILREDPPDLSETNRNIAPALSRIINHCLEKSPEQRFHSARDLAFAIEALSKSNVVSDSSGFIAPATPKRKFNRELIAWIAAGVFLVAACALAALYFLRQPVAADQRPVRFAITMPEKATTDIIGPVISPDGRTIAFLATSEGKRYIYIRPLDSMTPQRLAGTEDAYYPFWSPDSRYIGFFSNNKLKKIEASGGPPQILCNAQSGGGGTWNRDGVILFGMEKKVIHRVSAAGGEPAPVTTLDESRKEAEHVFPVFLPDGRHFFYYGWNNKSDDTAIYVASLDGKERKLLLKNDSNVAYVSPGYLLFARGSTLMAQPFDASKLELTGEPFPVQENVTYSQNISYSNFSVSEGGVMVFWSGTTSGRQLAWFDRTGKQIATVGAAGDYNDVMLSPDEKRAATQRFEGGNSDVWLVDLVRSVPSRFTFSPSVEDDPAWSPDGSMIAFTSNKDDKPGIYRKNSSGAGGEELLASVTNILGEGIDWSKDGKYILFQVGGTSTGSDLWVLPLFADAKPYPVLQSEFDERFGRFSPDGRWIAYMSNESGRPEVYVQSFPPAGGKWQISNGGGAQPHWRRDGKELFYIAADKKLMAVEVKAGATFEIGTPTALFQTRVAGYTLPNRYAPTQDGQRFLVNSVLEEASQTPITVILNWNSTLKKQQ
ncbi:MAG: protein kinase [Pyrinomonadaceae bacterium]